MQLTMGLVKFQSGALSSFHGRSSQGRLIMKDIAQLRPPGQNQSLRFRLMRFWKSDIPAANIKNGMALLAVDAKGDAIHIQIREKDLEAFKDKFEEGAIYNIAKFQVMRATAKNLAAMRDYMIYLTSHTVLKRVTDDPMPYPRHYFQFLDREKMLPYVNTDKYLTDVIGTLISIGPVTSVESTRFQKSISKRDIYIRDLSGEELRVTIWESCFGKFNHGQLLAMQPRPVLLFAGVTAKIFRGVLFVASTSATAIYLNLDIPETAAVVALQGPGDERVDEIPAGEQQLTMQQRIDQAEAATLAQLLQFDPADIGLNMYKCEVVVEALHTSNGWFYYGCNACNRSLKMISQEYCCNEHGVQVPKFIMMLPMTIKDSTAEMEVTAFENHAETMTDVRLDLMATSEEVSKGRVPDQVKGIVNKRFTLILGLSAQAVRDHVLTYRVYKSTPILERGASPSKDKAQINSVDAGVGAGETEGLVTDNIDCNEDEDLMREFPTKKIKIGADN